jgi:hypothetical protein
MARVRIDVRLGGSFHVTVLETRTRQLGIRVSLLNNSEAYTAMLRAAAALGRTRLSV